MKQLYIFLFFFIGYFANAQLETANWYFGQYLGLRFDGNQVIPLSNGSLSTGEGCASISDSQGNLLFYTDGSRVFNRNHQIMLNGIGLLGNSSSTQSAMILPYPNQENKYVIFTVSADDTATITSTLNQGFNYYYVDMTMDNGMGAVVFPENNRLLQLSSEKVAAVKHINRKDYWIVTHFENRFYSYLLSSEGVSHQPIISTIGPHIDPRTYPVNSRGYLTISPNGQKLAIAHLSNLNYDSIPQNQISGNLYPSNSYYANGYPGYLGLYNFNKATGRVSNEIILDVSGSPYGVQFSPNSKVLYANSDYHSYNETTLETTWLRGELFNFNLTVPDNQIASTKQVINTYRTLDTQSLLFVARGALQLALNNKIYYTRDYKAYLSHIQDPNNYHQPQFEENGILFPFASWNVIARYGLPPFISSSFERDIIINNSDQTTFCYGDEMNFSFSNPDEVTIQSYLWDFGDGTSSVLSNPTHRYNTAGIFTVRLKLMTLEFGEIVYETQITVNEEIIVNAAELTGCDTNADGSVNFDLTQANQNINPDPNLIFKYFKTQSDAVNDQNEIEPNYVSTSSNEVIYVRVQNNLGCYSITTITLNHTLANRIDLGDFTICIDGNSEMINLSNYDSTIENYLINQSILSITYYLAEEDMYALNNPVTSIHLLDESIQVYASVEILGQLCHEIFKFNLQPSRISFNAIEDLYKCKENSVTVTAPVGYTYQWIGLIGDDRDQNITNQQILIRNAGAYQLKLISVDGCEKLIPFNVIDYAQIEIVEVKINNGNSINIIAIGENLQYSLDGINWQSENVFVNLPIGVYKVFVKNEHGCVVESKEVSIFQITNFLSPNLDLINDKWRIPGLETYDNVKVKIYNRYGKVLVDKTIHFEKEIWDGKYQNKLQPSDSYWYRIDVPGNLIYTGHVLLKNKI